MTTPQFDESNVRWYTLEGIDQLWYHILEVDEASRIVDILFKFGAHAQIVLHRHRASYRTFIIQGELRLYDDAGAITEIRPAGSYVSKEAGGAPHREGGGDVPVIALFSNRQVEGPIYELLDDAGNTLQVLGFSDFKALYEAQG